MKKIISLSCALLMLASCFIGCTAPTAPVSSTTSSQSDSETPDSTKNTGLVIWYGKLFATAANDAFVARVEQFAEEKDVTVNVEMLDGTQLPILFNAGIEAGAIPDVAITADYITLHLYPDPPFEDLTQIVKDIEKSTGRTFTDQMLEAATFEGKVYRMPFYSSGMAMYYRKDLLTKAGITTAPETWADVFSMAAKITKDGVYGLGIGCGPTDNDGEDVLRQLIWSYGGSLFDKEGNPDPAQAGTIEAIQLYVDSYKAGSMPDAVTTWNDSGNNTSYLAGESAIVFNAFTLCNALKGQGLEELLSNTGVALLPEGPKGRITLNAPSGFSIFKDSKNKELAVELLTYLADKDWYNSLFSSLAPVMCPAFNDTAEDSVWLDPINSLIIKHNANAVQYGYPANNTFKGKQSGTTVKNQYLLNRAVQRCIIENISVADSLAQLKEEMIEAVK